MLVSCIYIASRESAFKTNEIENILCKSYLAVLQSYEANFPDHLLQYTFLFFFKKKKEERKDMII